MYLYFNKFNKKNIGTIYKSNSIDINGIEAVVDIDLSQVNEIIVNFQVGENTYTDSVIIKNPFKNIIQIPFKTTVLKQGLNSFEVVAYMKNGDIKPSQTCEYYIEKSIENINPLQDETKYPILIKLIDSVEEGIKRIDEAILKIPSKEDLKGEKGDKGDKGDPGLASIAINDTLTSENTTYSSKKIDEQFNTKVSKTANSCTPLSLPFLEGGSQGCHPSVKYFENGWNGYKYWMAYTPFTDGDEKKENPYVVNSNDGVNWQQSIGLPLGLPNKGFTREYLSDTELVYNYTTEKLECWYRRVEDDTVRIVRRITSDGVNWEDEEELYVTNNVQSCMSHTVIYEENKYKIWYVDKYNLVDNNGNNLAYAESVTGKQWNKIKYCNVPNSKNLIWHTSVTKFENLYYHILNISYDNSKAIAYSISSDNINFTEPKVIITPSNNSWDSNEIYRSSLIVENGLWKMYYNGNYIENNPKRNKWYIGLSVGDSLDSLVGINNFSENKFLEAQGLKIMNHLRSDLNSKTGCYIKYRQGDLRELVFEDDFGNKYSLNISNIFGNWAKFEKLYGTDFILENERLRLHSNGNTSNNVPAYNIDIKTNDTIKNNIYLGDKGMNQGTLMLNGLYINNWRGLYQFMQVATDNLNYIKLTDSLGNSKVLQPNYYLSTSEILASLPNPPNGFRVFNKTIGKEIHRHNQKWVDGLGNEVILT